ncbi:6-phosphogluconate dehydrogenase [Trichophaea hybrida]|nr:6-phosphogluconate dehydrogenase [Trichophaea hybrida]
MIHNGMEQRMLRVLNGHILNEVQDKVVQDSDNTEGTGVWTLTESATRHVSIPTIAASHYLRIASSNRAERLKIFDLIGGSIAGAKKQHVPDSELQDVLEDLRLAVPSLSASMEYLKYCGARQLPTQFMETQLDCFGAHAFDRKCEGPGDVKKGSHHHEWKPA